jgi:HAD superfamily hydrolase (TIGR01450 family)
LAQKYDTALLDLDGVVYLGDQSIPGVIGALNDARDQYGMTLTCVTNNAARSAESVAEKLQAMGLAVAAIDVVTSAQAGAAELAKLLPQGSTVFILGSKDLAREVELVGLVPTQDPDQKVDAVIQGFWPDMPWRMLDYAAGILHTGVPWVATNMDLTIPTKHGTAPGNGSMVQAMVNAVGREPTLVAGKPQRPLMQQSIDRTGAKKPLVVGDRLDTDIWGANNVGIDSLLVFSGVTSILELLEAPIHLRPAYIAWDATDILKAQVGAKVDGAVVTCGGWILDSGDLMSQGDSLDAVRAAAVAHWTGTISLNRAVEVLEAIGLNVQKPPVTY